MANIIVEEPPETGTAGPTLSVGFVLLPKFTLMAFAGFVEALRHAADIRDRSRQVHCRWSIVGPDLRPVKASCGVAVTPWNSFDEDQQFDYVAVVGGLLCGHEHIDSATLRFIERTAARGTPLIGLCTGSFVLARAGLMDGRRCCVSYYHVEDFRNEFAHRDIRVQADALFVADGNRITCAGGLGAVDLAVYLIERHLGPQRAQKSIMQMISDQVRPSSAPQPRFDAAWYSNASSPLARRAILLMQLNTSEPLPVQAIANRLGVSLKKLERVFKAEFGLAPASSYKKIRLEIAQRMLTETQRPIMNIALDCGFGDISYFGRAFRSTFGVSPRHFRRRLAAAPAAGPASPATLLAAAS
jgi:transcriptional regulator GlxA family with amidase domain